jgi:hypothetical protein
MRLCLPDKKAGLYIMMPDLTVSYKLDFWPDRSWA